MRTYGRGSVKPGGKTDEFGLDRSCPVARPIKSKFGTGAQPLQLLIDMLRSEGSVSTGAQNTLNRQQYGVGNQHVRTVSMTVSSRLAGPAHPFATASFSLQTQARRCFAGLASLIVFLSPFMLTPISAQLRNMSVSDTVASAHLGPLRESARSLRALQAENAQLHQRISQLEQGALACKVILTTLHLFR